MNFELLKEEFEKAKGEYKNDSPANLLKRPLIRAIIWDKTGGQCWYCGIEMNPFRDFSIDHFLPATKGGLEDFDNLVPCCRNCNNMKKNVSLERFRALLAHKLAGQPSFNSAQVIYLLKHGIELPLANAKSFRFYYEQFMGKKGEYLNSRKEVT